jgi:DNA-directed RNA polymerase subunit beta
MNYINALPDFLATQRISFCWFITQGLTEELAFVSRIQSFYEDTEWIMFAESYSLLVTRKFSGNYSVQLVIPMQIRNKIMNSICYYKQFPSITLPLMTTDATFIINGCNRVIVSQIVRSPGIYFEKNKNQKRQNRFKRKLSTDISKLRSFLPSGEPSIFELSLFFPTVVEFFSPTTKRFNKIANWKDGFIYYYSLQYLKQTQKGSSFYFLKCFKLYKIISKTIDQKSKVQLIKLFLKWLNLKNNSQNLRKDLPTKNDISLIQHFNFLLKLMIKYNILQSNWMKDSSILNLTYPAWFESFLTINKSLLINDSFNFSKDQVLKLYLTYDKTIKNSQTIAHIQFNSQLFLITKESKNWLVEISNFSFLKKQIKEIIPKLYEIKELTKLETLKPAIYFSISFKDLLKYIYVKEPEFRSKSQRLKYLKRQEERRHKYLKTKNQYLLYQQDHEIKLTSNRKYDEKDLYTATLIPDYGSWIRFGFQKNTKINSYKYPLKNQEDEIIIQLDKINQKPILYLLKEMGLTDLEIHRNLQYADFFYFNKPLLLNSKRFNQPLSRFNLSSNYFKNISEFSRIFDPAYYRLGRVGRKKINTRLNLKISERLQTITYEDIFAITDKLISLTISKTVQDDIDHLKNRRVRSVGELLQNLFRIGFQRLARKLPNLTIDSDQILHSTIITATIREFFVSSQLSQYLDQTNPLASLTHKRRISGLGPGGFDPDKISFAVRAIHPSHYGRICPIETPEGKNVGLIASLTTCARVNKLGFLETPFWRVINGKVIKTNQPIYLTAEIEDFYKIAPADIITNKKNYLTKNLISVRYQQDFMNVTPSDVDFIAISAIQIVSVGTSLIPFFEHDDANRALMGSNMQRQSVPLVFSQKPIIGTGLENQIAMDSAMTVNATSSGIVDFVTANKIIIKDKSGKKIIYKLQKYFRSNQKTCINHRPIVWKGEKIKSGQILTDGPSITSSELSLGQNVLVGYMPWQGYNFEDAILISERLVYEDIFTSIHIERYKIEIDRESEMPEQTTKNIPNLSSEELQYLNEDGIVTVGTFVKPGDILVGKIIPNNKLEQLPESKLLRAIFGVKAKGIKDNSYRMPDREYGRVIETLTFNCQTKVTYQFEKVHVFIAQIRKIKVGDKIAGRHGNKGIISRILARQDMPFLPDGTPIDVVLNPLGVPSRMNVGQLYECLLGLAGDKLNARFKILPFDEMYGLEVSRILINKKLRQASLVKNESWLFNPYAPGKIVLMDGRTGTEFENPVTIGNAYMLKLIHLVDDKMHARATGPYSLITQQPLRGKAHHGGQRFGEMEVWALEGFGAAFTLQELLTIKSDDIPGRNETVLAIVKGRQIPRFGVPESFKVLLHELRSIGLDISTYKIEKFSLSQKYEVEVNLTENYNALSKTFSPTSNINDISF